MTTINNVVNAATLANISDEQKFTDRKIGKLSLELPTPVGVAKFDLQDYSCKSNSKEVLAAPPETVVVSAATNEMDLKKASLESSSVKEILGLALTAMTQFAAADAEAANRRHNMEMELLKLRHEMEIQTMKLRDELEAARHQRIQESKRT